MAAGNRESWVVDWTNTASLQNAIEMVGKDENFGLWLYNAMYPIFLEAKYSRDDYPIFALLRRSPILCRGDPSVYPPRGKDYLLQHLYYNLQKTQTRDSTLTAERQVKG